MGGPRTYHASLCVVSNEGIPQYLGEFTGSEGNVSPLVGEGADALLEGQEALVDLRSFHPRLAVGALRVLPSLITYGSEVKKRSQVKGSERFLFLLMFIFYIFYKITERRCQVISSFGFNKVVSKLIVSNQQFKETL